MAKFEWMKYYLDQVAADLAGATLAEEVGEAAKEALEHHWAGKHYPPDPDRLKRLRAELVQVAAVAVAMIESLDRNELR